MLDKVVHHCPSDARNVIDDMLLTFHQAPQLRQLIAFFRSNQRIDDWFASDPFPVIKTICLAQQRSALLIDSRLPPLDTEADVMDWLGLSANELTWYQDLFRRERNTLRAHRHYHYHTIQKRNGTCRLIEAPKRELRSIQRKVLEEILPYAPVHDSAHGFRKGRSCITHAAPHCQKQWLFTFDLTDYFHSIGWRDVRSVFRGLGYHDDVSRALTALTTHHSYIDDECLAQLSLGQRTLLQKRHLPQGAPTSPLLSNAAMIVFDRRLSGLAGQLGMDYTRYGDDFALSGQQNRDWQFLAPLVGAICLEQGMTLNHRKSRVMRPHQKQRLTGIVVNTHVNVDRQYVDRLKATLTNCIRCGLHSQNRDGHPNFSAYLQGCIAHVMQVNPTKGRKLEALYREIKTPV